MTAVKKKTSKKSKPTADLTLNERIALVKTEMVALTKDQKGYNYKYADLNQHIDMIEPLLEKNGLVLTQPVMTNGQVNMVSTEISLKSDITQVAKSQLTLPAFDDLQKIGSAITYARRYTLNSFFGMKTEDNDGADANNNPVQLKQKRANSKLNSSDSINF